MRPHSPELRGYCVGQVTGAEHSQSACLRSKARYCGEYDLAWDPQLQVTQALKQRIDRLPPNAGEPYLLFEPNSNRTRGKRRCRICDGKQALGGEPTAQGRQPNREAAPLFLGNDRWVGLPVSGKR